MQINETSRTFVMDAHILRYLQEELGHKVNFDTIESVFEEVARTYHLIPGNLVFPVTGAWIQRRCSVGETRAYNAINALVEAKILVGTGYANPLRKRNRRVSRVSSLPGTGGDRLFAVCLPMPEGLVWTLEAIQ